MPTTKKTTAQKATAPVQPTPEPAPETAVSDAAQEAPASAEPVVTAPAEEPVAEAPAEAQAAAPEPLPPAEPVALEPAPEPAPETVKEEIPAEPVSPEPFRLGQVEGLLHRLDMGVVLTIVGQSALDRIAAMSGDAAVLNLQEQVVDTEGQCAPPIFTVADGDDRPRIFSGYETIAAAVNAGMTHLHVVTIHAGDAGAAQTYIAGGGLNTSSQLSAAAIRDIIAQYR